MNIFDIFFPSPKLSREAFEAYFNRLPDNIKIQWQRDGEFIIGKVKADDKEFVTQGKNVEDFIKMVNESVYTVFDIPFEYMEAMKNAKTYNPTPDEFNRLHDGKIPNSFFVTTKNREVLQVVKR